MVFATVKRKVFDLRDMQTLKGQVACCSSTVLDGALMRGLDCFGQAVCLECLMSQAFEEACDVPMAHCR